MEVYIEYVIIDNLIINFLLLLCTIRTLGLKVNKFRICISSMFGTVAVCLFPLISIPKFFLIVSKLCVGIIMVLLSFSFKTVKQFLYAFGLFILYTFLMGGACFAVIKLLGGTTQNITMGNYDTIVPVSIVIFSCFMYTYIILRLTKYIYRRKDMIPFMHTATLSIGEKSITLSAYVDSGNRLYDKTTGAPIIIISAYALEKVYSKDQMVSLVFGEKNELFNNVHFVSYSTIEGVTKKMVVFVADKLKVENANQTRVFENISVGVTFKKFNDAMNYDMLLHPSML